MPSWENALQPEILNSLNYNNDNLSSAGYSLSSATLLLQLNPARPKLGWWIDYQIWSGGNSADYWIPHQKITKAPQIQLRQKKREHLIKNKKWVSSSRI